MWVSHLCGSGRYVGFVQGASYTCCLFSGWALTFIAAPARRPPSLTHISSSPWDQRKPTYSLIINFFVFQQHNAAPVTDTWANGEASPAFHSVVSLAVKHPDLNAIDYKMLSAQQQHLCQTWTYFSVIETLAGERAFSIAALKAWNNLPLNVRQTSNTQTVEWKHFILRLQRFVEISQCLQTI